MKKIVSVIMSLWIFVCVDSTQLEIDAVNDIVVNHQDWLQSAWNGKASRSKERVVNKAIEDHKKNRKPVRLDDTDSLIRNHLSAPGYKNRSKRDRE